MTPPGYAATSHPARYPDTTTGASPIPGHDISGTVTVEVTHVEYLVEGLPPGAHLDLRQPAPVTVPRIQPQLACPVPGQHVSIAIPVEVRQQRRGTRAKGCSQGGSLEREYLECCRVDGRSKGGVSVRCSSTA